MGNFRLGGSHRGASVSICMHMLLNTSLIGYRDKLTVLAFLLELAGRHFFKPNPRLRILNTCLGNLRLLIYTSLGII